MVITNVRIITNDEKLGFIDDGAISIENGEIVEVGKKSELISKFPTKEIYDGSGMFAIPGLINLHVNLNLAFIRSPIFMDRTNILKSKRSLKRKFEEIITPEMLYVIASFSALESLKNGVTTVMGSFISKHPDLHSIIKSAFENIGIRGIMGREICGDTVRDFEKQIESDLDFHKSSSTSLYSIQLILKPHDLLIRKNMEFIGSLDMMDVNCKFTIECFEEKLELMEKYNMNIANLLMKHPVSWKNLILVPFCNLSEDELDAISSENIEVVLTPRTNAAYGLKHTDVIGVMGRGINAGLGTGDLDYNIIDEFRSFLIFQGDEKLYPETSNLYEFIISAFKGGYRILEGITGVKLGKIKPGYKADIVLVDAFELPEPKDEILYRFLTFFLLKQSNIRTVFINGRRILEDGILTTTSHEEILREVQKVYKEIFDMLVE